MSRYIHLLLSGLFLVAYYVLLVLICISVCYVQIYSSFTFRLIPCGVLCPSGAYMYTSVLCPDIFIFYFQAYSLWRTMSYWCLYVYQCVMSRYIHLLLSGLFLVAYYVLVVLICIPVCYVQIKLGALFKRGVVGMFGILVPILKGM